MKEPKLYRVQVTGACARLIRARTRMDAIMHAYRVVSATVATQADLVAMLVDDPTDIEDATLAEYVEADDSEGDRA